MLTTTPAAIRYGYGFGPRPVPATAEAILDGLKRPDRMPRVHPGTPLAEAMPLVRELQAANKARKREAAGAEERHRAVRRAIEAVFHEGASRGIARILDTDTPFRERLVWFWHDHFTARALSQATRIGVPDYIDSAIRPHVTGRFADMLRAAVMHPLMLVYLDQHVSIGPNSRTGQRTGKGLNENLAREVLELHTLGVGAGYTQSDVTEFAELLTGLTYNPRQGVHFLPRHAEPGAETILSRSYGGRGKARIEDIEAALEDLAMHPETARHLASKLAVHFVSMAPDPELVEHIAAAYLASGGELMAAYAALLEHPGGWETPLAKAKTPFEFIASTAWAAGIEGREITRMSRAVLKRTIINPMARMGQPYAAPPGPDGWPEKPEAWINPAGLAARIEWSMRAARELAGRLGDPREFVDRALGRVASERLRAAVAAAETRNEGLGLVLASAEFNRR